VARAFAARGGAAFAVFLTIAVVLLVGGGKGQLASADAIQGDTGSGDASAVPKGADPAASPGAVEEPVLGMEPPEETPPEEPAAAVDSEQDDLTAPAGKGETPAGPPAETGKFLPSDDDDGDGDGDGDDGGNGWQGEHDGGEDSNDDDDDGKDSDDDDGGKGWNGDDGNEGGGGEGLAGRGRDIAVPLASGGGKGSEPGLDSSDDEEPGPVGRPQVTQPVPEPAAVTPPATGQPSAEQPQVGDGTGTLRDSGTRAGERPSAAERTASFTTSQRDGRGDGGAPAGDAEGTFGSGSAAAGPGPGTTGSATAGGSGDDGEGEGGSGPGQADGATEGQGEPNIVERTVRDVVEVVPDALKAALAALAALSVLLGLGYLLAALRARRLARQRHELLQEVGLLQTALLPPVPDKVGALRTSVAYRPAEGPGAGGDFYDVLPLTGGRVGFILGDVSGHGRGALARTAFMRYTLRAYLEAGLEPRVALQVAGRVIDDNLGGDFATVLLAVHDPETGSLTYATAGHPAPIVVGPQPHDPVTAASSPPIGVGVRTGLRQTTVPLVPGSVACLFTDGLMEARVPGGILGRERLAELLEELGDDATARRLLERVATEANARSDDMAAVLVSPTAGVTAGLFRTEQLELSARELEGPIGRRFLEACGLPEDEMDDAERDARLLAERFGGVVLHVVFGNRLRVEVLPRNVESIEAASRRVTAGSA
jgi:serine phosphatase RsbU (regulator of sigma subunit)